MFLPFSIFGRGRGKKTGGTKKSLTRRPRVAALEYLEDRLTPAIVDVGDSIAIAQVNTLLPLVGGIRYDGQIGDGPFGTRDVDLFKFDVLQGATLRIETSLLSPNPTYDTYLRLFNSAGTQIAFDDDAGVDNFSLINTGSLSAGTYYVGVSGFPNSTYNPQAANSGAVANNFGFYTLNIMDTSFGFTLNGIDAFDGSGASVSSAGDINGDGFDDLIIGAPTADPNGQNAAGESYVIFGKASGFGTSLNLSTLNGTNGFVINGIGAEDNSGTSVSSAGDINGDGFDDLLIGAPGRDRSIGAGYYSENAGESYVVFGKASGFTASLNLSTLNGTNGFVIRGIGDEDYLGTSVSAAGDINGDGFDDLIIGADRRSPYTAYENFTQKGESYVVYGKGTPFGAVLELFSLGTNGFFLRGIDAYDQLGYSVSAAGDINGDGFDDFIIGAFNADPNNQSEAGESYVVFGKGTPSSSSLNLPSLDGANGFVINGIDGGDQSGFSVSSAGDINGDGFDDLIIGATYADPNGQSAAGESYVVFGKASGFSASLNLSSIDGTNGFVINGIDADDQSGFRVSAAGDVNGDGFDDLIISATGGDPNSRVDAGESYVVFGKASGFGTSLNLSSLNGTNGFVVNGIDGGDRSGVSVSSAGDINGDGFDDLIIGAFYADPNGISSGESYVIFGRNFTNAVIELGTALANSLGGNASANTIVAGGGNDTIFGNGGADVIYAGQGNDQVTVADLSFRRVDGGSGVNRLNLSGSNQTLNLTTLADNRLINFSQIDLTGIGNNTLVIAPLDLLNMQAQADTLIVTGNAGDVVRLEGPLWSRQADETVLGQLSFVYRVGRAVIKIPQAVTVQTPAIINLSSLNGTTGFVLNGIDELDRSGFSVSSAGDINGDGFDDLIIGAYYSYANNEIDSGESYVVFGKAGGFTASLNLSSLNGTNGFVIGGIDQEDLSGFSVSSAGDINGDGFDDLIIGAPTADPNGPESGESYVVFGKGTPFAASLNLSTLNGSNGFVINGIDEKDASGFSVSSAGDINGDGFDDLIIGATYAYTGDLALPGASYVVFGKASGFTASLDLSALDGTNGFALNGIGVTFFDKTGYSVSSAGDINGDGFDDLIIGAPGTSAGRSYVVYGRGTPFAASLNLFNLNNTLGFVIEGNSNFGSLGSSVSSAGDINGDGFDDLIIGARNADANGLIDAGESYVVFGKAGAFNFFLSPSSLDGTNGFVINGIDGGDRSGFSVSSAGDINGDGFDDLIIGAPSADPSGRDSAGESYVVFGKASGFTARLNLFSLNSIDGFVLSGIDAEDNSGISVSSAGDINGDGFDDLIIGAALADPSGRVRAGESYVIFGRNFTDAGIQQGTAVGETINGTSGPNIIVAGQGNDTISGGGGGADVIYAGQGNDFITIGDLTFQRVDGGTGIDTLRLGNVNLNLSSLANNRLTNIEIIDLATTAGAQTLTVNPLEVLNISSSTNELTVDRADEDNVLLGTGWSIEGVESRNSKFYFVYRAGAARLLVQTNANLFGAGLRPNLLDPNLVDFVWNGAIGDNNVSFSFDGVTNILTQTVTKFNGVDTSGTLRFMGITGNIILQGSGGKDTIDANGLGDMSLLGRSAPTILGGGGGDSLVGSAGADYISTDGAEGADTIDGGAGNDTIFSGGGADSVRGGFGNDNIVDGGEGRDTIDAGDGNDTVQAGDGADSVIGGIGNDVLIGDAKDSGRKDRDTLLGGSGRDILMGGLGADSLNSGDGEDLIIAGNHTSADLALSSIMLEWTSARTFAQRTANIAGTGTGPRANGNEFLQVGTTVVNDNVTGDTPENIVDIILGGSTAGEADWIFADNPIDTRSDFQLGVDLLTDLSP